MRVKKIGVEFRFDFLPHPNFLKQIQIVNRILRPSVASPGRRFGRNGDDRDVANGGDADRRIVVVGDSDGRWHSKR